MASDQEERGRRIRAARALAAPTPAELQARAENGVKVAGITTEELAARIRERGFSAKTIGQMELGQAPANRGKHEAVARACGLPYEFFTFDLQRLSPGESTADRVARIERALTQRGMGDLIEAEEDAEALLAQQQEGRNELPAVRDDDANPEKQNP